MKRKKNKTAKAGVVVSLCLIVQAVTAYGAVDNPRQTPVVKVVRQNADAVVNISTERIILLREHPSWGTYGSEFDSFFEQFFNTIGPGRALKLKSVGSGVILNKAGLIVTNAHVVNMASNIVIILNDGTSIEGNVVYEDANKDLALVKIEAPRPLKEITLAASGDIIIGETVVAIGNPLGLENSVTVGIISGKERNLYSQRGEVIFDGLIQTDAPINPGNSGGALFNLAGELVGINVAVVQNSQSIGFAIPVEKIETLLDNYKSNKALVIRQKKRIGPSSTFLKPGSQSQRRGRPHIYGGEWEPFSEFSRMRRQMDQMMQDMFDEHDWHRGMGGFGSNLFYDQSFDMEETDNEYIIRLDVADLNKDKINIEVNRSSITITGERSEEKEEKGPHRASRFQSFGSFSRTVPIPKNVDTQAIGTEIKDNTLIITLPKK